MKYLTREQIENILTEYTHSDCRRDILAQTGEFGDGYVWIDLMTGKIHVSRMLENSTPIMEPYQIVLEYGNDCSDYRDRKDVGPDDEEMTWGEFVDMCIEEAIESDYHMWETAQRDIGGHITRTRGTQNEFLKFESEQYNTNRK